MSDQNSQGGNGKNKKNGQGGFMAVLHNLEEQFYGPETNKLTGSAIKVLLYLRHRAFRDWTKRKQISKHEIQTSTGLDFKTLKRALSLLEKKEFIFVIRTKAGKVWTDNTYELHPKRFGTDYIYRPEKPSFKVIYGSKEHKSNPSQKLSTNSQLGSQTTLEVGPYTTLEVGSRTTLGEGVKNSESLMNSASKNPLKEPIKRTLSENEINLREKEREEAEKAKAMLSNLVGGMFGKIPR